MTSWAARRRSGEIVRKCLAFATGHKKSKVYNKLYARFELRRMHRSVCGHAPLLDKATLESRPCVRWVGLSGGMGSSAAHASERRSLFAITAPTRSSAFQLDHPPDIRRRDAALAQLAQPGRRCRFRQLAAIVIEHQAVMMIDRRRQAQQRLQQSVHAG